MNNASLQIVAAPTRADAFRYWLRLGFVSFGGPAGQIASGDRSPREAYSRPLTLSPQARMIADSTSSATASNSLEPRITWR